MWIHPFSIGQNDHSDKSNCSVRALANASGLSMGEAHEYLRDAGRMHGSPAGWNVCHAAYVRAGAKLVGLYGQNQAKEYVRRWFNPDCPDYPGLTLKTWLDRNPQGRYIVNWCTAKGGHVFAVIDGKIIDTHANKANKRIISVWQFP